MSSDESIPISALQHYLYCPRQCALIHLEHVWVENVYTVEGRQMHDKAHLGIVEHRGDCRIATGLLLRSEALGLTGQADVVEFFRQDGCWQPYPVEYKLGRPKSMDADCVQLCAQALCLEEMLGKRIPEGALFYGKTRRRVIVIFDSELRERTVITVDAVRTLLQQRKTPPPPSKEQIKILCSACSLRDDCMPMVSRSSATRYLQAILEGR